MLKLLSKLMPRERRFFDLFDQHATFVYEGSVVLSELLHGFADVEKRTERTARILELEHSADRVTRETVSLLHKTFVTPLDRDDIHRLISRMDDVLDLIQDVTEALQLYDIRTLTPEACELADLLRDCCKRMQQAVHQLSKLFREEEDVRQLIKLETVYQMLESATDQCEDVANIIEGVILENA